MPTLVADVEATPQETADVLIESGLSWANAATGEIAVWTETGERLVVLSPDQALQALVTGSCLQLWLTDEDDLAIGTVGHRARLYFDGFSAHGVATVLMLIQRRGLVYRVSAL